MKQLREISSTLSNRIEKSEGYTSNKALPLLMVMAIGEYDFRAATMDDIEALVQMWCESAHYHEEIETRFKYSSDVDEWTTKYFSNQLPKDSFTIFIASKDAEGVGFVEVQVMEKPPIHAQRRVGYVCSMFVKPQCRRKGIGSHLWGMAHDWLMKQKVSKFQLAVAAMNPDALEFWKKLGFQVLMFQMECKTD
ncbi:MAG: GNAT family N-acetyltransferase [Candidatus Thorarchaeota archaeon]